jgi:hypothetical protein
MKSTDLKTGYYYYAENDKEYENFKEHWKFIGKIVKVNSDTIEYKVIKGSFVHDTGNFFLDSAHYQSIKGVSKTKKGLFVYMI